MASLRHLLHRRDPDPGHASPGVRSRVAMHHADLDRDLAAGVPAATSPAHAERARQLVGRHVRHELPAVSRAFSPVPSIRRTGTAPRFPSSPSRCCPARADLERLRAALLVEDCRSARGVALASVLLHDDHSPIFTAFADTTVSALAQSATTALAGEPTTP